MIAQPIRTARLFSRREIILASRAAPKNPRPDLPPASAREFRVMQYLIPHGEPAHFELSESNFIEAGFIP
jgi:hypothetical protein